MTIDPASILVVDDNRMNRLKFARELEKKGHEVSVAEDGQKALDMLRSKTFDLVLLDVVMPEVDGFQVLEQMKQDSHLQKIPVIMVSAADEAESVDRCLSLGASDFLTKPVDRELLHARVAESLAKRREG